jgi:hypothetical protein
VGRPQPGTHEWKHKRLPELGYEVPSGMSHLRPRARYFAGRSDGPHSSIDEDLLVATA